MPAKEIRFALEAGSLSLSGYADEVRRRMREIDPEDRVVWQEAYEHGLQTAYGSRDFDGFAEIALFAAVQLDSLGYHEDALTQFDFALAMTDDLPDQSCVLLSYKAFFEALGLRIDDALLSLKRAAGLAATASNARISGEYAACSAMIACLMFGSDAVSSSLAAIRNSDRGGFDWQSSAVRSWLIPYLFARGERTEAMPWIRSLHAQAEVASHPWRRADAVLFQSAAGGSSLVGQADAEVEALASSSGNFLATWRLTLLRVRRALLRGDWDDVRTHCEALEALRDKIHPAFADGAPATRALVSAYSKPGEAETVEPGEALLPNVGALLMRMEAVAIAGTQSDAARWASWSREQLPASVKTSLEWPVSRDRVEGLLQLRAGNVRGVEFVFRRGMQWAEHGGYHIEAALTRLQLGEVGTLALDGRQWPALRNEGWSQLDAMGIDPTPHAYAAARAFGLGRSASANASPLTPRESEVLATLASGLTYREAAEQLGVDWRTVQSHAYHIYGKLGVRSKVEAITVARELGVL